MLGTFRVFLAGMVVLSHLFIFLPESNARINQWFDLGKKFDFGHFLGAASVSGFFMISGFVMTQLIYKHYGKLGRPTFYFYLDRFLRIFPQFLFFLVLTQVIDLIFGLGARYLSGGPSFSNFSLSALLVPVNYALFFPLLENYQLLPQSWSLALEEQYYWIFPLIILEPYLAGVIAVLSFGVFLFASQHFHYSHYQSLFIFRFLPGVLFIFLFGKFLADYNAKRGWRTLVAMILIVLGCIGNIFVNQQVTFFRNISMSASMGVIMFGPALFFMSKLPRRPWDTFLGNTAYGIFLSHYLFIFIFLKWQLLPSNPLIAFLSVFSCAFISGLFGHYFIEKYFDRVRYRLRSKLK
jgi:peptidoglycan/LPS O-acetylase OafA/YrhL